MLDKIECVTAFDAEKVPVDPAFVTICPTHDGHSAFNRAGTECGCTSDLSHCEGRPDLALDCIEPMLPRRRFEWSGCNGNWDSCTSPLLIDCCDNLHSVPGCSE